MHHLMSYDVYDIKIWHQSILPILVSKEAYGPQQSHLLMQIWLNKLFQNKIISIVHFENSFLFFHNENRIGKSHFGKMC